MDSHAWCWDCECKEGGEFSGCIDHFIGDGYCDGPNNNADCGFDEGDCCIGTGDYMAFCEPSTEDCACHQ